MCRLVFEGDLVGRGALWMVYNCSVVYGDQQLSEFWRLGAATDRAYFHCVVDRSVYLSVEGWIRFIPHALWSDVERASLASC